MNISIVPGTVFNNWTILADAGKGKYKEKQVNRLKTVYIDIEIADPTLRTERY